MNNSLVTRREIVAVSGKSKKDYEDAVQQAFGVLRNEVTKNDADLLIKLEPLQVEIVERSRTETAGLFQKKAATYRVDLKIEVEMKFIESWGKYD